MTPVWGFRAICPVNDPLARSDTGMSDEAYCQVLEDELATIALAKTLCQVVEPGDLIALSGDLGAGKSTLARAFIREALGDPEAEVPSPTFTLVQEYDHPQGYALFHADLYRLSAGDDIEDLGLEDEQDGAVMLVEWPDRLPVGWHNNVLDVALELRAPGSGQRLLTLRFNAEAWKAKLQPTGLLGARA